MATEDIRGQTKDRDEVLALHHKWMEANRKGSIPMMREVFVAGDKFDGFNLNGHRYETIAEWATLWKFLGQSFVKVSVPDDTRLDIWIRGDVAWVASESEIIITMADGSRFPGSTRFRSTEVYSREDERGNKVWKMWHFHCSPIAEGPRPGAAS